MLERNAHGGTELEGVALLVTVDGDGLECYPSRHDARVPCFAVPNVEPARLGVERAPVALPRRGSRAGRRLLAAGFSSTRAGGRRAEPALRDLRAAAGPPTA